jgi:hypothetical protein
LPALSDFLRRFRFHAVPGALAAVPIDRTLELERELDPLFSLLERAHEQALAILAAAARDAEASRAEGSSTAASIRSEARAKADSERLAVTASLLEEAARERTEGLGKAHAEAGRIDEVVGQRLPALAERLVGRIVDNWGIAP